MAARSAISIIKRPPTDILQLQCHVRPGTSKIREGITAINEDVVELCVAAQAQEGKANRAVIEILSDALGMAKSDLQITHGQKTRDKTVAINAASLRCRWGDSGGDLVALVRGRLLGGGESNS